MTQVSLYMTSGKDAHRLNGLWSSISWSGESTQVYRTLEFTLENTANGITRKVGVNLGALVRLTRSSDGYELFRGYVFDKQINAKGEMSVTCYDAAYYLTVNEARLSYKNKTASSILRDLCKRYSLPVGPIASTSKKLPSLKFRGATLDKIITTALTETRQAGGKKYVITCVKGKVGLREVPTVRLDYRINSKYNIISSSYRVNNEDRRNSIRLTGGKEEAKPTIKVTAKNATTIKKYGLMAHYEHKSSVKKSKQLTTLAKSLLKKMDRAEETFTLEIIGNLGYRAGKRVHVTEPMSGRKGLFYIADDTHDWSADGSHTVSLTLTNSLELAYENYTAPSEAQKETKPKTSTVKKTSAKAKTTTKAQKVAEYAKTEKGKHVYTFGGKRYGSYDCSGWTYHVYSKFGVNIGHGSSNQARAGRYIKQSQIQAGDLIIMKNTYRTGISHVGIAISRTQMIHQGGPNGKRGPTVASIAPGSHFGGSKHYHSARRVL